MAKLISTKFGKKGTCIEFDATKRNEFIKSFQKKRKESKEKNNKIRKYKEQKIKGSIKKDVKEAMKCRIKEIEAVTQIDGIKRIDVIPNYEATTKSKPRLIKFKGEFNEVNNPWSVPCTIQISDNIDF
ncbi:uncharacterized protein CMU_005930 [Cryptosporidium muris RN66]|uniref:Uncharacterized protein n=1 Tax=Cryptosporidium muris (strain RN66) TaxID=441375 RepID=B6AHH5_CRYMR|nr:uncharacterized protein CMU_005930 [Cryptosporidium muris RN66]EEA07670.1 hypothetical protein CMU_005930 [Cryptosporidium muris RN66]|eukprot:XP_002142019.1 hypothetical protein [Cryptosporidium muris RN66]